MSIKEKHQKLYMDLAKRIAEESYATRLKVGCLVVKDDNIISMGWNGTPPGWENECEELIPGPDGITFVKRTKPEIFHAEENALLKLAREGGGAKGSSVFVTISPCMNCARMIYKAGIERVYCAEIYQPDAQSHSGSGVEFLRKCGIEVIQC